MLGTLGLVAAGGAIGAVMRFGVVLGAQRVFGAEFPVGTLAVNVVGSFLMGIIAAMLVDRTDPRLVPFLMTGVLGGFTTFSAFSLDAVALWERGALGLAAIYVVASVLLSIAALVAGLAIVRGGLT